MTSSIPTSTHREVLWTLLLSRLTDSSWMNTLVILTPVPLKWFCMSIMASQIIDKSTLWFNRFILYASDKVIIKTRITDPLHRGIHRLRLHKRSLMRNVFPCHNVISSIEGYWQLGSGRLCCTGGNVSQPKAVVSEAHFLPLCLRCSAFTMKWHVVNYVGQQSQ